MEYNSDGFQSRPVNAAGFFIHSEIHKARPDVHAVCHAHSIAGRAWSAFAKPLEMINQDICNFYKALAVYADYGGAVLAAEEGRKIALAMGKNSKVCQTRVLSAVDSRFSILPTRSIAPEMTGCSQGWRIGRHPHESRSLDRRRYGGRGRLPLWTPG